MNFQERYDRWVQERRQPVFRPDFADRVMEQVRLIGKPGPRPLPLVYRALDWIALHPFAQAAAILLAVLFSLANGALLLQIGIG